MPEENPSGVVWRCRFFHPPSRKTYRLDLRAWNIQTIETCAFDGLIHGLPENSIAVEANLANQREAFILAERLRHKRPAAEIISIEEIRFPAQKDIDFPYWEFQTFDPKTKEFSEDDRRAWHISALELMCQRKGLIVTRIKLFDLEKDTQKMLRRRQEIIRRQQKKPLRATNIIPIPAPPKVIALADDQK